MTELVKHATERANEATACVVNLLHHYGFELGGYTISQLLLDWQEHYPAAWIRLATVEALYQGRYKAISVEQILAMWQRRHQPIYHFNHEFERLVCDKLPEDQVLSAPSSQSGLLASRSTVLETKLPYHSVALQLPSFEGATLPESDVMLALRTLHSKEMAVLTDAVLIDAQNSTEPQTPTEASEQVPVQTYSYNLRSEEQPSHTISQAPDEVPAQGETSQSVLPPSDAVDRIASEVNGAVLQGNSIAPQSQQPEREEPLATNESVDNSTALALPTSNVQARSPLPNVGTVAKILQQLDHQEMNAKAAFPGLELLAPTLKPKLHLTTHYQPIWLSDASIRQPIHQFTPSLALPDFYSRLKAIAQPPKEPEDEALSQ